MLPVLPLLAALAVCPAVDVPPAVNAPAVWGAPASDSVYAAQFAQATPYATFLANATARRELWDRNASGSWSTPPDALVQRARATGGGWRLLAVAIDSCSDSVNTIPYIARLVALLPGVELRILPPDLGRAIMDAHRTPDQRAATPTVLLLDANFVERGAFIERPPELQQWMLAQKGVMSDADAHTRKMAWYDEDKGVRTLTEIVALMERAQAARR